MRLPLSFTVLATFVVGLGCQTDGATDSSGSEVASETGDGDGDLGDGDGEPGDGDGDQTPPPPKPDWLTVYTIGDEADADVDPLGPGVLLMGGGADVNAAFTWQSGLIAGGDIVVLRASGSDGYNSYLYNQIGGADSVQTLLITSAEAAADPWVAWTVAHAEAVFMAGGDQAVYMELWKDSPLADAIMTAWDRGAVIGGTSAGLAVMGEFVFAAYNGTVYPEEALEDPYNQYMELDQDFLAIPTLAGVITDSHFFERDRMGRLLGFAARVLEDGWSTEVIGLGVDERTAMVIGPDGVGEVLGNGSVYLFHSDQPAAVCSPGLALEYGPVMVHRLAAGDTATWPGGQTAVSAAPVSASGGFTVPADPY